MIIRASMLVAILLGALALGGCDVTSGLAGDDAMSRYTQRLDTITPDAGDDQRVNLAIQTEQPWPYYVMDQRIPVDAQTTSQALDNYHKASKGSSTSSSGSSGMSSGISISK